MKVQLQSSSRVTIRTRGAVILYSNFILFTNFLLLENKRLGNIIQTHDACLCIKKIVKPCREVYYDYRYKEKLMNSFPKSVVFCSLQSPSAEKLVYVKHSNT